MGGRSTLVLSPRFSDDSNVLWRAALDLGIDVERARGMRLSSIPSNAFLYGEPLFADAVAEPLGISLLQPTPEWLPSLSRQYLGRWVELTSTGDLFDRRAAWSPLFVKPPDDKLFAARVYDHLADLAAVTHDLPGDTAVLVSSPVRFEVEYRAFVAARKVLALSVYVRDGAVAEGWVEQPGEREGALGLLNALLADEAVSLPPALVIDVGRLDSGEWVVVEGNPAWASGLCGCDPAAVLQVLAAAAVPRGTGGTWARQAKNA